MIITALCEMIKNNHQSHFERVQQTLDTFITVQQPQRCTYHRHEILSNTNKPQNIPTPILTQTKNNENIERELLNRHLHDLPVIRHTPTRSRGQYNGVRFPCDTHP